MSVKLDRGGNAPTCSKCLTSLMGRQYLIQKSEKFCVDCYESLFCNSCHTCGKIITTGAKDLVYKNFHFHDGCFTCSGCQKSLTGQKFIYKDEKFICAKCYENKFSPKCTSCKAPFKPGVKRMEYKGKSYHENCFCCSSCEKPIGKKSFLENEGKYFCQGCYEAKLANKCARCKKEYLELSKRALEALIPFPTTYLCEAAMPALVNVKTTYRNRLKVANDMRIALSNINPRIDKLVLKRQEQKSH